jgi:hypothetical protein
MNKKEMVHNQYPFVHFSKMASDDVKEAWVSHHLSLHADFAPTSIIRRLFPNETTLEFRVPQGFQECTKTASMLFQKVSEFCASIPADVTWAELVRTCRILAALQLDKACQFEARSKRNRMDRGDREAFPGAWNHVWGHKMYRLLNARKFSNALGKSKYADGNRMWIDIVDKTNALVPFVVDDVPSTGTWVVARWLFEPCARVWPHLFAQVFHGYLLNRIYQPWWTQFQSTGTGTLHVGTEWIRIKQAEWDWATVIDSSRTYEHPTCFVCSESLQMRIQLSDHIRFHYSQVCHIKSSFDEGYMCAFPFFDVPASLLGVCYRQWVKRHCVRVSKRRTPLIDSFFAHPLFEPQLLPLIASFAATIQEFSRT